MPSHDLAEGTAGRGCNIKFLGRQPACKHLHNCLVLRDVQKLMRRTIYGGRNAPVQDAMRNTVVMERIAEIHNKDAAIDIRIVTLPAPAHRREVGRHNQHLVSVCTEATRTSLKSKKPVGPRWVIHHMHSRRLTVAGAWRGEGERNRRLDRLTRHGC